ncbi:MAG: CPBP family intramembrane metalloprotease [Actinobacteria bacterium]|nr:CPBP family intramembrane metalloprotease [Actinomycetota bacterium]
MIERRFRVMLSAFLAFSVLLASGLSTALSGRHYIDVSPVFVLALMLLPLLVRRNPFEFYGLTWGKFRRVSGWQMLGVTLALVLVVQSMMFLFARDLTEFAAQHPSKVPGVMSRDIVASFSPWLAILLSFFQTAAGTFLEEAGFRGLLQKALSWPRFLRRLNPWLAIVVQAVLFGAVHAAMLSGSSAPLGVATWIFLYPTVAGLVLGYVCYRYNSILPAWYIHWGSNFLAAILAALGFDLFLIIR